MADERKGNSIWDAGFEADRTVIVSRLGLSRRLFPKPLRYTRRFYHEVMELPIEDWTIPVPRRELGPGCCIEALLTVRFQPTVRYARRNVERLPDLGTHIRRSYLAPLLETIEEQLRSLEDPNWLTEGCGEIERNIETAVHELLALREIQSRARCVLQPDLSGLTEASLDSAEGWSRYRTLQAELLRRQRALAEEMERQRCEEEQLEREKRFEIQKSLLDLEEREQWLQRTRESREVDHLKAQLAAEEQRQAEQRLSEARLREEQIRHEARLRQLELDIDLQEQERRAQLTDDTESRLRREIELLAMERQRLLLEEEIREIKLAKAKGWVINAKRRFPLGRSNEQRNTHDAELREPPDNEE